MVLSRDNMDFKTDTKDNYSEISKNNKIVMLLWTYFYKFNSHIRR